MRFQLNIREDSDSGDEGSFGPGAVFISEGSSVRVGSSPECECRIEDSRFAGHHFSVIEDADSGTVLLRPVSGAELLLDDEPVTAERELLSGAKILAGGCSMRFDRLFPDVPQAVHSDFLGILAKVLVLIILVAEVSAVIVLPVYMRRAATWDVDVARERVLVKLDRLRKSNVRSEPATELERSARKLLADRLNTTANYVRTHEDILTGRQWQDLYGELLEYEEILGALTRGVAFHPHPEIQLDRSVEEVLEFSNGRMLENE